MVHAPPGARAVLSSYRRHKKGRQAMPNEYDSAGLQADAEAIAGMIDEHAVFSAGQPDTIVDLMCSSIGQEYDLGNGRFGFHYLIGGVWVEVALSRVTDMEKIIQLQEASE
jgi:hypothetical protein